ncbi:uncharacterized protein LOC126910551 isoform X1 [Daktulosphaira vitifoliae]|uniref:uncharacterized protein LOC126910551 isoform X1 n=1 Tax=Daktulosphaira vitifoliae TaxID=58002 RepID=UPI0021A98C6D|nr:uncharacterized protein LOC126910551 isoform X1 [Daktulosphaira vitifoliae]
MFKITQIFTGAFCLTMTIQVINANAIDQEQFQLPNKPVTVEARGLDAQSMMSGIAQSLMSRTGGTSSQNYCIDTDVKKRNALGYCKMSSLTTLASPCRFFKMATGLCDLPDILSLSLNVSNVMLMVVLKALIWGAAYMTGGHKGRKDNLSFGLQDIISESDVLMFLGFLVADESGHYDCLNRVACEQPTKAISYLKSAEMVWQTAKMFDGVIPLDNKYEKMMNRLQEAIEDGRANANCQAIYKCSEPPNDRFNTVEN